MVAADVADRDALGPARQPRPDRASADRRGPRRGRARRRDRRSLTPERLADGDAAQGRSGTAPRRADRDIDWPRSSCSRPSPGSPVPPARPTTPPPTRCWTPRRSIAGPGLAGVSLAWGLWDATHGMGAPSSRPTWTGGPGPAFAPLAPAQGLALFDRASPVPTPPSSYPSLLTPDRLRPVTRTGTAALRGLVGAAPALPPPRSRRDLRLGRAWERRSLPEAKRSDEVLDLVRAVVGGRPRPREHAASTPTARSTTSASTPWRGVDLRNRLGAAAGLRLPATAVFDHPRPPSSRTHAARAADASPRRQTGSSQAPSPPSRSRSSVWRAVIRVVWRRRGTCGGWSRTVWTR